mmetsp:Transcript_31673/g.79547  ORF Transcript_31673/g.79547 Transcript_31673/m.79547 type:complete len:206 (-) Transcript_31673:746-1363(-)
MGLRGVSLCLRLGLARLRLRRGRAGLQRIFSSLPRLHLRRQAVALVRLCLGFARLRRALRRRLLRPPQPLLGRRHELRRAHQLRLCLVARVLGLEQCRRLIGRRRQLASGVGKDPLSLRQLSQRRVALAHGALEISHTPRGPFRLCACGVPLGARLAHRLSRCLDVALEPGHELGVSGELYGGCIRSRGELLHVLVLRRLVHARS